MIKIFTDGACKGNPGSGSYCSIIMDETSSIPEDYIRRIHNKFKHTTNNRMELNAVVSALAQIVDMGLERESIEIYTDSKYVADSICKKWIDDWVKTDKVVSNPDLWSEYIRLRPFIKGMFRVKWVKGHADNIFNNYCDEFAVKVLEDPNVRFAIDEGYERNLGEKGIIY